jgi:hypothetical protein
MNDEYGIQSVLVEALGDIAVSAVRVAVVACLQLYAGPCMCILLGARNIQYKPCTFVSIRKLKSALNMQL